MQDQPQVKQQGIRALRIQKTLEKTGLSRTHLYRLIKNGDFPAPHKLSAHVSVWDEAAVDAWLAAKFAA